MSSDSPTADPSSTDPIDLRQLVREIPDFPKPGILFRDMGPMLRHPQGWQQAMDEMGKVCQKLQPDLIVGIESRGFIVGVSLATAQKIGFIKARKQGKLPPPVETLEYDLEYGSDAIEVMKTGFDHQPRVLIVDDLLATGGTAKACSDLVTTVGGEVCGFAFLIELAALGGRRRLPEGIPVESLIRYD